MTIRQWTVTVFAAASSSFSLADSPDEFVEYVESTGTQYVKTGVEGRYGLRIAADFSVSGSSSTSKCEQPSLLGVGKTNTDPAKWVSPFRPINLAYGKFAMHFGKSWSGGPSVAYNTRQIVDVSLAETGDATQKFGPSGKTYTQNVDKGRLFDGEMYLFACNWDGAADGFVSAKIYRLRIWERASAAADWQLVRDFRPCKSGGKGALYDSCEEKLYFSEVGDLKCSTSTSTTDWKAANGGAWNEASNWTACVPASTVPARVVDVVNQPITVSGATPTVTKDVTVFNIGGDTTIDVASGATLPFSGVKQLYLGCGTTLNVGSGAAMTFDGTGSLTTHSRYSYTIDLEGSNWNVADGGTVSLANYMGRCKIGAGSVLSVGSGSAFTVASQYYSAGLDVMGGALDVSGTGRIVKTGSSIYQNVDGWVQVGFSVQDGQAIFSDTSRLQMDKSFITVYGGTLRFSDESALEYVEDAESSSISANAVSGAVARLEFTDSSKLVMRRRQNLKVNGSYFGDSTMMFASSATFPDVSATPVVSYAKYARFMGVEIGCGKLNQGRMIVSNATVNIECNGTRIARIGRDSSSRVQPGACSVGELIVVGTGEFNNKESTFGETNLGGLIVGDGTECDLANPGRVKGSLYIGDQASVKGCTGYGYFGVGMGVAEGKVVQAGGTFSHGSTWQMILGAFGGEGSYVMSNGTASVSKTSVYVGGCPTNCLSGFAAVDQWNKQHNPQKLAACCPVTNHCAKGLLQVDGGSFEVSYGLVVSADGEGVVSLGPNANALVLAKDVVLSNSTDAAAGVSNVARVKFTFGSDGVGRLVAGRRDATTDEVIPDGKVVICTGAVLDVDAAALSKTCETRWFPLVTGAQIDGEFATVNVVGARDGERIRKTVHGKVPGYWFVRPTGVCIVVR